MLGQWRVNKQGHSNSRRNEQIKPGTAWNQWNPLHTNWTEETKFRRDVVVLQSWRRKFQPHKELHRFCSKKYGKALISSKYLSEQGLKHHYNINNYSMFQMTVIMILRGHNNNLGDYRISTWWVSDMTKCPDKISQIVTIKLYETKV